MCPSTDHAQESPCHRCPPVYLKVTAGTHLGHLPAVPHLGSSHLSPPQPHALALVTLPAIYMESNTTKVCLTASFRHFLATGNKRKKKNNRPFGQPAPRLLFASSQFEELRMWEPKLTQNSPLQGWKRQKQGAWCPPTAGYRRTYTGITVTCSGQIFWNENTRMCTNLTSVQASGHLSMQFWTNKTLLWHKFSALGNIIGPKN